MLLTLWSLLTKNAGIYFLLLEDSILNISIFHAWNRVFPSLTNAVTVHPLFLGNTPIMTIPIFLWNCNAGGGFSTQPLFQSHCKTFGLIELSFVLRCSHSQGNWSLHYGMLCILTPWLICLQHLQQSVGNKSIPKESLQLVQQNRWKTNPKSL